MLREGRWRRLRRESQKNSMCRREAERASALGQWGEEGGITAGLANLAKLDIKALECALRMLAFPPMEKQMSL